MLATLFFLFAVIFFVLAVFGVAAVFTLGTTPLGLLFVALGLLVDVLPPKAGL